MTDLAAAAPTSAARTSMRSSSTTRTRVLGAGARPDAAERRPARQVARRSPLRCGGRRRARGRERAGSSPASASARPARSTRRPARVADARNLPNWIEPFPLAAELERRLGTPVSLDNDVTVATRAEFELGAGRDHDSLLGVFWGTGVGGGIIARRRALGRPRRGRRVRRTRSSAAAARCAAAAIAAASRPTRAGCRWSGGPRGACAAASTTELFAIARQRGKTRLTSSVWAHAYKDGDRVAIRALERAADALGLGIASAINLLDLPAVVIGGGMGERFWETHGPRITASMQAHLFQRDRPPALLGERARRPRRPARRGAARQTLTRACAARSPQAARAVCVESAPVRREPLFEHRLELAGYATRALELEGEGPPLVLLHGYRGLRRHLAPGARPPRPRATARALAVDLPGFGRADDLDDGPMLPQYDRFAAAAIEHAAGEAGARSSSPATRSAAASRCARRSARTCRSTGSSRSRRPGSTCRRGSRSSSATRSCARCSTRPSPMPELVVRRSVGEVYRQLVFARPGDAPGELVAMFTSHHRVDAARSSACATSARGCCPS